MILTTPQKIWTYEDYLTLPNEDGTRPEGGCCTQYTGIRYRSSFAIAAS